MVEVFPFKPNWSEGVEHTLSYKTDIFTSRSGKEQRRALRSTPRRTVSYSSLVCGDEYVKFQRLMATKQNADFQLVDWSRSTKTHGIEAGATHFSLRDFAPEWLVDGVAVFLGDGATLIPATVDTVSGYTVELTAPVALTLPPTAIIRPGLRGQLGSFSTVSNTSNVVTISVSLDITPGSIPNSTNRFHPWIIGGKEVFGFNWNWGESVTTDYQWPVEQVDFQRGVTTTYRPVTFGSAVQKATLVRQTEEIDGITRFLERQKGQQGEFWMPSGTSDIALHVAASEGATSISVAGGELYEDFGSHLVYKAIAIYLRDGRKVFRKINSIGLSSGNSVLNLNSPLTFAIAPSDVAKISWLRPARFASDEQSIEYLTDNVAQLQVTTTTVSFSSDPQDFTEMDGAGHWVMDNWSESSEAAFNALDYMVNIVLPFGNVVEMDLGTFDDVLNSEMWRILNIAINYPPPTGGGIPTFALQYSDGTPLQYSDGTYLEFSA